MAKVNKKQKVKKKYFRYFVYLLYIVSLITLICLFLLDVIPITYYLIIVLFIFIFNLLMTFLILGKGFKKRILGFIVSLIYLILMLFITSYSFNTLDFLNKINGQDYNTKNYSVVVLKSSMYEKVKELKSEDIGIISISDDKGAEEAKKYLNKKVKANFITYDDLSKLFNDFINEEVEAILIEDSEKSILEEEHNEFVSNQKVIYSFSIDVKLDDDLAKEVDISKEPFNIYISGIDTYGKITSVSRSDVNMVVTVNPQTHEILFTSIPRDYYVKLHGVDTIYNDKLTHAGIYGIDMSVKTIEDLLDTDINYYAKVNFTSLVTLVDELGGIEVDNEYAFRAYYTDSNGKTIDYSFEKGKIKLDGKEALAYSRERKSLAGGDLARVKHQQQVLEAIINKALSKNIIVKYGDILDGLEGKVVTNIGTKNITKLVKTQIKQMPSWTIEKNTLAGVDGLEYTYSYKSAMSYVMIPDEESLSEAKSNIKSILEGA